MRLNKKAAERFIRAGLWDVSASETDRKRKLPVDSSDSPSTSKRFHSD